MSDAKALCDDLHAVQKCYRSEESLYFNLLSINCEVILYCFSINSSPILMFCFYSIKFAPLREVVKELRNAGSDASVVFVRYISLLVDFN